MFKKCWVLDKEEKSLFIIRSHNHQLLKKKFATDFNFLVTVSAPSGDAQWFYKQF